MGVEDPAKDSKPPDVSPDYNPDHHPVITHDIREKRGEEGKEDLLAPFDANAAAKRIGSGKRVTVAEDELNRLRIGEEISSVILSLNETEIPAEHAQTIGRVFIETFHGSLEKRAAVEQAAGAPVVSGPIADDSAAASDPTGRKHRTRIVIIAGSLLLLSISAGLFIYYQFAKREKELIAARAEAAERSKLNRLFSPGSTTWEQTIERYGANAKSSIVWITSNLNDSYTWSLLQSFLIKRPSLSVRVFVVSPSLSATEVSSMAARYNITTILVSRLQSEIRVQTVLIDSSLLIDGSNGAATWLTAELADIDRYTRYIDATYVRGSRVVYDTTGKHLPAKQTRPPVRRN